MHDVNVTCNIKNFSPFPVEERFLLLVQPTLGVSCAKCRLEAMPPNLCAQDKPALHCELRCV
jgi:hypothetical protein